MWPQDRNRALTLRPPVDPKHGAARRPLAGRRRRGGRHPASLLLRRSSIRDRRADRDLASHPRRHPAGKRLRNVRVLAQLPDPTGSRIPAAATMHRSGPQGRAEVRRMARVQLRARAHLRARAQLKDAARRGPTTTLRDLRRLGNDLRNRHHKVSGSSPILREALGVARHHAMERRAELRNGKRRSGEPRYNAGPNRIGSPVRRAGKTCRNGETTRNAAQTLPSVLTVPPEGGLDNRVPDHR